MNRSYWMRQPGNMVMPGLAGFGLITLLMRVPPREQELLFWQLLIMVAVCCPYTFKTAAGRLWWGALASALACSIIAVLLGIQNPLSWMLAVIGGCAFGVSACLRWNPPKE